MDTQTPWTAALIPPLAGTRALVTGANSGIGFHTALELARAGAEIVMPVRDRERGAAAVARIVAEVPAARLILGALDLASLASIRAFADGELAAGRPLDLLINNAGVMAFPTRELTPDGFERQVGTNHLGHFALTLRLLPLLARARAARIVTVSSGLAAFGKIDLDNLQSEKRYSPNGAYEVSKLANLMFMRELQRRVPANVVSVAAHPGVCKTDLAKSGFVWLQKKLAQPASMGALPQLYAAVAADVAAGDYYGPRNFLHLKGPPVRVSLPKRALDDAIAGPLWARSEELTGVSGPSRSARA